MQERHEQQAAARLEFERERAMVDAVMQAIEEEDRLQGELKRHKAAETMKYIHDFIADRDDRREQQRQAEFAEERKIQVRHPVSDVLALCPKPHANNNLAASGG